MTDPTITDLRRELDKARDALISTQTHLAAHAEMNAALHCSTNVMYSPLHAKVTAAVQGIELALQRTEGADSSIVPEWRRDEVAQDLRLVAVLMDLDRCQHGRHAGDDCVQCQGGISRGNPHVRPGSVIGYGLRGDLIVMPDRDHKHDPAAWRTPPADTRETP